MSISPESVVEVVGVVNREPQSKFGGIEVVASKVQIISSAETLPFPINREVGLPPFNTLNIYRPLTLRKLREMSIFKIQSEVVWAFREFLRGQGFTEIQSTKLSSSGLEGGSEIFGV